MAVNIHVSVKQVHVLYVHNCISDWCNFKFDGYGCRWGFWPMWHILCRIAMGIHRICGGVCVPLQKYIYSVLFSGICFLNSEKNELLFVKNCLFDYVGISNTISNLLHY